MSEPAPIVDPTSAASARPRRQFPCLDAFRAIAMTMIIVFHADYDSLANSHGELGAIFRRLDFGVALFFVPPRSSCSGHMSLLSSATGGMRTVDFYQHRVLRIFRVLARACGHGRVLRHAVPGPGDALSFVSSSSPAPALLDPRTRISSRRSLATEVAFPSAPATRRVLARRRLLHHARPHSAVPVGGGGGGHAIG
jgi:hypothetical protein